MNFSGTHSSAVCPVPGIGHGVEPLTFRRRGESTAAQRLTFFRDIVFVAFSLGEEHTIYTARRESACPALRVCFKKN
jgi:hypothetical protein